MRKALEVEQGEAEQPEARPVGPPPGERQWAEQRRVLGSAVARPRGAQRQHGQARQTPGRPVD
jgi:hypothetical protein